ncbi:MAG: hypothetical protein ACI3T9_01130 [Romboutsia timonensis]
MFDNLSMEEVIDRLKEVRDSQKSLKEQEDALKKRILEDGRTEIKSENHTMKIQVRSKEVFNEEAFIEKFKNDQDFDDTLKAKILESKVILNQANLNTACQEGIIPIDYVLPFNSVTESKVITVK